MVKRWNISNRLSLRHTYALDTHQKQKNTKSIAEVFFKEDKITLDAFSIIVNARQRDTSLISVCLNLCMLFLLLIALQFQYLGKNHLSIVRTKLFGLFVALFLKLIFE